MSTNIFRRRPSRDSASTTRGVHSPNTLVNKLTDMSPLYERRLFGDASKKSRRQELNDVRETIPSVIYPAGKVNPSPTPSTPTLSSQNRSGGDMAGMLDTDRTRTRRERTFIGSECAVCEEPLEHTLRGERILQFSCSHVSHEACFYEYIKEFDSQYCPTCNAPLGLDTSRGGNVLDIEKLSSIVRSVSAYDQRSQRVTPTPSTWDNHTVRPGSMDMTPRARRDSTRDQDTVSNRDVYESRERSGPYVGASRHSRNGSDITHTLSVGYPETSISGPQRQHDCDAQPTETGLISPRSSVTRNPIPPPTVSMKSEFPTLNRSRLQQTVTCLVTVEVPDIKWRPDPDDLRSAPVTLPPPEDTYDRPPSPAHSAAKFNPYEPPEVLEEITKNLLNRVENWHGLDFTRFGKLRLHGTIRVGKDKQSWQELECFLFAEMLICVKEKKSHIPPQWDQQNQQNPMLKTTRCTLKGSILIRKHLNEVIESGSGRAPGETDRTSMSTTQPTEEHILTLSLSVAELPSFHLRFENRNQLRLWQQALADLNTAEEPLHSPEYDHPETEEEEWHRENEPQPITSINSSYGAVRAATTTQAEYPSASRGMRLTATHHVPIDLVIVIPVSSSMQGVKISLVRDALKFLVQNLGDRDRMGLVTYGAGAGAAPLVGMTTKAWPGWSGVLASIRPVGQKMHRVDVVEGANIAMDLLMQRKSKNPIASILLISDSSTSEQETVDFVVSRAEAAKIAIHSFGLGMTHKPDNMIELSTRTKASYTYVKDWMMLRECVAGVLGAMQTMSHQNVKLKLRLPEGSPAKFVKINGALHITKRATGKDAEASLGDMRFGDKRDILVQLVIAPDNASQEQLPQDPWESIVSGLEALGGPLDMEDEHVPSVEEIPLLQADLVWGDILRDGTVCHLPRPSLLAITLLPAPTNRQKKNTSWSGTTPILPHSSIVQRRMELLTSDMLTRALTLVSRGQHERAQHLLNETRSILKGLGKGGLPPIPPTPPNKSPNPNGNSPTATNFEPHRTPSPSSAHTPSSQHATGISILPSQSNEQCPISPTAGVDAATLAALDAELETSLEWINHPAVFGRDSRKAVLQAIGVISSQRGYTFRTPVESLWAGRLSGVKKLTEKSKEWRKEGGGEGGIMEES